MMKPRVVIDALTCHARKSWTLAFTIWFIVVSICYLDYYSHIRKEKSMSRLSLAKQFRHCLTRLISILDMYTVTTGGTSARLNSTMDNVLATRSSLWRDGRRGPHGAPEQLYRPRVATSIRDVSQAVFGTHEAVHATEDLKYSGDDLKAEVFRLISARARTPGVSRHLLAHFPHEFLHALATDTAASVATF